MHAPPTYPQCSMAKAPKSVTDSQLSGSLKPARFQGCKGVREAREAHLHDDCFASGVASSQNQHHLPGFHELAHFCRERERGRSKFRKPRPWAWNSGCAHYSLGPDRPQALIAGQDPLRSRRGPKDGKHPIPLRNATPRPRMAADCKTLPKPTLTDSRNLNLQRKGRNGPSSNLSPQGEATSLPITPLRLRPASSWHSKPVLRTEELVEGKAGSSRSFIEIKLY